jgi:hypothetical protein
MENRHLVAVVSDTGPLIHLSQIDKLFLLKKLLGVVFLRKNILICDDSKAVLLRNRIHNFLFY